MDDAQPPPARLLLTGFVAAAAAVAPVAAFVAIADPRQPGLAVMTFLFGMPVALLHVYLIGLPVYVVLRETLALSWPRALLGGFLVGAAPAGLASILTMGPHPDVAWIAAAPGALGMVGAAAFRAMVGSGQLHR